MSVRFRLAVLNMLAFAIVLGVFGGMVRVQVDQTLREGVDWQLKRRAQRVVPRDGKYSLLFFEQWRPSLSKRIGEKRDGEIYRYSFYDKQGKNLLQPELRAHDEAVLAKALASNKPVFSTIPRYRCYTVALVTAETAEPMYCSIVHQ